MLLDEKKSEEMLADPSRAAINAMASKSKMNGTFSSYPFAPRNNQMSNASIVGNPKTVREWANQKESDFSKAFTDANITSSLMKKA